MKIESGIPFPKLYNKYPFAQMQPGDSFALPEGVKPVAVNVAARRHGDKYGARFTVRKDDNGVMRCWRVS